MRSLQTLAICALAATAFAQQQNPQSTATNPAVAPNANQTTPAKSDAPATDPTSTTSTAPAPPAQTKEDKSVTPDKQAQQGQQQSQQSTPTQTSQQKSEQQSKLPQSDASPVAPLDTGGLSSAELQARIEAALHSEPTLNNDVINVNVTEDEIVVTGTVATGKERTTASRIVQSFGENRKVKEKINVSGVKK